MTLNVAFAGDGSTTETSIGLTFDNTFITLSNATVLVPGSVCTITSGTRIAVTPKSFAGAPPDSTPVAYCSFDVAIGAGASDGLIPFTIDGARMPPIECADDLAADVTPCDLAANQGVTVATTPVAPDLSFTPSVITSAGNIGDASTGTIVVSGTGGAGGGTASFTCTQPAGFTVTNTSQSGIGVGDDPADMDVSCTLAAAQATQNMSCNVTDGAGTRSVSIGLTCPAGSVPTVDGVISTSPASGSTLAITGRANTTGQTTVALNNTNGSGAGQTTISCSATAPVLIGFVGGAAPSAGPISQVVSGNTNPPDLIVQHPLTSVDQPAVTNGVVCTQDFANDALGAQALASFDVDPAAGTTFVPPEVIPATSLWSQLSLIGLFAALGGLFVALRRNG